VAEKGLFIEAWPRDGVMTFLALVKDKVLKPQRAGGWYLYLLLSDRTGELEGKAWDLCRSRNRSHYSDFEAMPGEVCDNYINGFLASHLRGIVRCLLVSKFQNEKTPSDWRSRGSRDDTACVESG
jgi:hypothetical protein